MAEPVLSSLVSYAPPDMTGETARAFDFTAGDTELALTMHWLGTKGKFVARLASDEKTFWTGPLNVDDPVYLPGILDSQDTPDLLFNLTATEDNEGDPPTPATIAAQYAFVVGVGRNL